MRPSRACAPLPLRSDAPPLLVPPSPLTVHVTVNTVGWPACEAVTLDAASLLPGACACASQQRLTHDDPNFVLGDRRCSHSSLLHQLPLSASPIMQCAALTRAGPVVGRPQSAASQPAARSSARSSVQQQQQRRRSLCRAQKVEEKVRGRRPPPAAARLAAARPPPPSRAPAPLMSQGDNLAALGDNYESDLEPKPYTLPINRWVGGQLRAAAESGRGCKGRRAFVDALHAAPPRPSPLPLQRRAEAGAQGLQVRRQPADPHVCYQRGAGMAGLRLPRARVTRRAQPERRQPAPPLHESFTFFSLSFHPVTDTAHARRRRRAAGALGACRACVGGRGGAVQGASWRRRRAVRLFSPHLSATCSCVPTPGCKESLGSSLAVRGQTIRLARVAQRCTAISAISAPPPPRRPAAAPAASHKRALGGWPPKPITLQLHHGSTTLGRGAVRWAARGARR